MKAAAAAATVAAASAAAAAAANHSEWYPRPKPGAAELAVAAAPTSRGNQRGKRRIATATATATGSAMTAAAGTQPGSTRGRPSGHGRTTPPPVAAPSPSVLARRPRLELQTTRGGLRGWEGEGMTHNTDRGRNVLVAATTTHACRRRSRWRSRPARTATRPQRRIAVPPHRDGQALRAQATAHGGLALPRDGR